MTDSVFFPAHIVLGLLHKVMSVRISSCFKAVEHYSHCPCCEGLVYVREQIANQTVIPSVFS